MAAKFECEVRFEIGDIEEFKKRLAELGAVLKSPYEFNDYYYLPAGEKWNALEKNLRIREWIMPQNLTTIYFTKNEIVSIGEIQFKRALYPQGKVPLWSGDVEICKMLLADLGFVFWFLLKKERASHWELPRYGFETVVEYIAGLGWSGELEFEGEDPKKAKEDIERALKILEISKNQVSFKPISVIVAEKRGILK
jgi:adenylate cyclase class IV